MSVMRSGDHTQRRKNSYSRDSRRSTVEVLFTGEFKAAPAVYAVYPDAVHPDVVNILTRNGARKPYSHQVEVAEAALCRGANVGLVTPTASGKTVAFLGPVLSVLVDDPSSVALLTYPTKALAADQLKGLRDLGFVDVENVPGALVITVGDHDIVAGVLDGDTDEATRAYLRTHARILLTNPPAIHQMILRQIRRRFPDGSNYGRIVRNLRLVVIDEAHFYHGPSGTQAALAFRRLFALVEMLTQRPPQLIVATATIGNPENHLEAMTGMSNFYMVTQSGAARQRRTVHIARPGKYQRGGEELRYSVSRVVNDLALSEMKAGKVVLVFANSRAGADASATQIGQSLGNTSAVASFHSGLPKASRADILQRLFAGEIRAVVATSALELGIDLGSLDTVILNGHPGDNASFGQRCGRVGRTRAGDVYLVLNGRSEMDVYLESNPRAAFWPPESRTIYTENRIAKTLHAACAMLETKSPQHVERWLGDIDWDLAETAMANSPHDRISMIGLGNLGKTVMLDPTNTQIGELSTVDALKDWHVNAVLRSPSGKFFRIASVHFDQLRVLTRELRPDEQNLTTSPQSETLATRIGDPETYESSLIGISSSAAGAYDVKRQTTGYMQLEVDKNHTVVSKQQIQLPEEVRCPAFAFETRGIDISLGGLSPLSQCCDPQAFPSTTYRMAKSRATPENFFQALTDTLKRTIPVVIQARSQDVELSMMKDGAGIRILAYDIAEGGMGWSEALFRSRRWLAAAAELLLNCECKREGCPRCSMAPLEAEEREQLGQALKDSVSI